MVGVVARKTLAAVPRVDPAGLLASSMDPPCLLMMPRLTHKPKPVP